MKGSFVLGSVVRIRVRSTYLQTSVGRLIVEQRKTPKGMTPPPWPHPLQFIVVALSVASLSRAMISGAPVPPTTA
jgi:hypothetical protein